jgi:hypothetical protein
MSFRDRHAFDDPMDAMRTVRRDPSIASRSLVTLALLAAVVVAGLAILKILGG